MKKHIKEAFKEEGLRHAFGDIQFPTTLTELKIPKKKRLYDVYGECRHCHLIYHKNDDYNPKYCCQCGQILEYHRELAAVWEPWDNSGTLGSYKLLKVNLSGKTIEKR